MAKSKTVWKWRGQSFGTKAELFGFIKQRVREDLRPPVEEVSGEDRQNHTIIVKVQLSLGVWPPRVRKPAASTSTAAPAAPGKQRRALKGPSKTAVDRDVEKYFG